MEKLFEIIDGYEDNMIKLLERVVNIDSGKDSPDGIKKVSLLFGGELEEMGFQVEYIDYPGIATHFLATRKGCGVNPKNIMIIGHVDTVFPRGTAEERPFCIKEGKAYGPGVLDMKSGITIAVHAVKALYEAGWDEHNITFLICGDEETGHPSTDARELFMKYAAGMDAVFNMETGSDSGAVVVGRKGALQPVMVVEGIAAHSGKDPEKGASAVYEAVQKVNDLYEEVKKYDGIQYNAGVIRGGIVANGIAAHCEVKCDFRFKTAGQYDVIAAFLKKLEEKVYVPGTKTTIKVDPTLCFLPMEMNDKNLGLYELVREQGKKIGIEVGKVYVGGSSDATYTSLAGAPTVCGMGARGELNHSEREYIQLYSLRERAKLLALTIQAV